jgi:hypothetical protein
MPVIGKVLLLPAAAVARWGLHPRGSAALSRHVERPLRTAVAGATRLGGLPAYGVAGERPKSALLATLLELRWCFSSPRTTLLPFAHEPEREDLLLASTYTMPPSTMGALVTIAWGWLRPWCAT